MITLYKDLFIFIYRLFLSVGDDVVHPTDENRAFAVVGLISVFEVLNVATFFSLPRPLFYMLMVVFFIPNYLFFLRKNRFLKFIVKSPTLIHNTVIIIYLIGTIALYVVTR